MLRALIRFGRLSAVLLSSVSIAHAANPSFDCSKARQPAEFSVCRSDSLAALDRAVARGYAYLKAFRGQQYADALAGPYLLSRYKCGFDEACIGGLYLNEIGALERVDVPASVITGEPTELRNAEPSTAFNTGPTTPLPGATSALTVPLGEQNGTLVVPVSINGQITLNFILDSGASDVSVPADVVMTLIRTGTITGTDFIGSQTYVLADGSKAPSERFVIRSLKVGSTTLENVTASVAPVAGSLLLGQSFLSRFGSWSVDNNRHLLVLGEREPAQRGSAAVVQGFYNALSAGNGDLASTFVAPEKRYGTFSASQMTRFYGALTEPLRLVSIEQVGDGAFLVKYTFRDGSKMCDGQAVVSTLGREDGIYISSIRALNGC